MLRNKQSLRLKEPRAERKGLSSSLRLKESLHRVHKENHAIRLGSENFGLVFVLCAYLVES